MGAACSVDDTVEKPKHDKPTNTKQVTPADAYTTPAGGAGSEAASAAASSEPVGDGSLVDGDDEGAEEAVEEDLTDSDADAPDSKAAKAAATAEVDAADPAGDGGLEAMFAVEDVGTGDQFMAVLPWVGAIQEPTDWSEPDGVDNKPAMGLEMQHVHGYRCRGVYDNVYHTSSGEILYPAAAVGVLQSRDSTAQRFFDAHTDDILSVAMDAERNMVVTGGKARIGARGRGVPPRMFVWDSRDPSKKPVAEIQGFHKRSINAVAFSPDGKHVVSVGGDNDHKVAVHEVATGALKASDKGGPDRIVAVGWSVKHNVIVTVGVKHAVWWEFKGSGFGRPKKGLVGRLGQRCTQLSVTFTDEGAWTGTQGGSIYKWSGNQLVKVIKGAHSSKVSALATTPDGKFVASGGGDKKVKLWEATRGSKAPVRELDFEGVPRALSYGISGDTEGMLLVGTLAGKVHEIAGFTSAEEAEVERKQIAHGHYDGETWGLAAHPYDEKLIASCGDDNMIAVWNLETDTMVMETVVSEEAGPKRKAKGSSKSGGASTMSSFPPNQCARAIDWGPNGHLVIGCNDGTVKLLDEKDLSVVATAKDVRDHQWIEVIKFDPTGDFVAVGAHDQTGYIYDTRGGTLSLTAKLKGHSSFLSGIDWTEDGVGLHTTCGAYELLFWDAATGNQLPSGATQFRDEAWATWTVKFGWPVQGIWPKGADGSDINAVERDHASATLATGDDWGKVKLFKYPCVNKNKAKCRAYHGHASHVTGVRFALDDSKLVSAGGNDNTLIVWRTVPDADA